MCGFPLISSLELRRKGHKKWALCFSSMRLFELHYFSVFPAPTPSALGQYARREIESVDDWGLKSEVLGGVHVFLFDKCLLMNNGGLELNWYCDNVQAFVAALGQHPLARRNPIWRWGFISSIKYNFFFTVGIGMLPKWVGGNNCHTLVVLHVVLANVLNWFVGDVIVTRALKSSDLTFD